MENYDLSLSILLGRLQWTIIHLITCVYYTNLEKSNEDAKYEENDNNSENVITTCVMKNTGTIRACTRMHKSVMLIILDDGVINFMGVRCKGPASMCKAAKSNGKYV